MKYKKEVRIILKQLQVHSPLWAKILKVYIRSLEQALLKAGDNK